MLFLADMNDNSRTYLFYKENFSQLGRLENVKTYQFHSECLNNFHKEVC